MGRHSANNSRLNGDARRGVNQPTRRRHRENENTMRGRHDASPLDDIRDLKYDSAGARRAGSLERAPERLQGELKRRRHRGRRIAGIVGIVIAAIVVIAAAGGAAYYYHLQKMVNTKVGDKKEKLSLNLAQVGEMEPYNLLIMGYDKRKGDTQYRTDTMLLARIDPKQKKVWLISLPRDYKVTIPGYGSRKLNAAYSFGQEKLAIATIENLTGQKINHYMGVDFKGFKAIINAMGGIEVDVPSKINDPKADYTADKHASKIDAGLQTLDGEHALVFVRTRHFVDADFSRMKNQQLFFKALANKATKMSATQLPAVVTSIVPYLSTDMSLMDLLRTARDLKDAGADSMYTTTLPGKWVSPFIVPDEEKKAEILKKFSEGVPFEGSAEKKDEASKTTLKPSEVDVTVRNGTTKVGVAKQAASVLKTRGFNVGEVGNTDQQNVYDKTMIIYKTKKDAANLVAKYLQPNVKIVQSRGMYSFKTETMVIIGKDWDIESLPVTNIKTN